MKLKGKQFINIVQAYAPTFPSREEELSIFYEQLDTVFRAYKNIVMRDLDAKVANSKHKLVVRPFGLSSEISCNLVFFYTRLAIEVA